MKIVKIDYSQWSSGLNTAAKAYDLFGPVKVKSHHKFEKLDKETLPNFDFTNTVLSPKKFSFPQSEVILEYDLDKSGNVQTGVKEKKQSYPAMAVLGVRPCDAKANLILQMNFDTDDVKDPYWIKKYEAVTLIGLACTKPHSTCFCTSIGCGPYNTKGLDVLLVPYDNEEYLLKIITKKGNEFVSSAGWNNQLPEKDYSTVLEELKKSAEKKICSFVKTDKLQGIETTDIHSAPFWNDVSFTCINCGICTFICPTCWCFDLQDEICGKLGTRMKNWDSCMFPIFTVHTTGHNPRATKKQRLRQRFMHKLKYFIDKYERGPMCVGCGRCIRSCPVNIDIREICAQMNSYDPEKTSIK